MIYFKHKITSEVRAFDSHEEAENFIDTSDFVKLAGDDVKKIETPRPSEFHTEWNDGAWVDPRTPEEIEAHRISQFSALKRRQFMRVLVLNGFDLDQIESEINQIQDTQTRQLALIDWKDATEFWRTDETLLMVANLLGLDSARIDAMWTQALTL